MWVKSQLLSQSAAATNRAAENRQGHQLESTRTMSGHSSCGLAVISVVMKEDWLL